MQKEALSSFMDGELINQEIELSSLLEDQDSESTWHRYHIAQQAMRNTLPPYLIPAHVSQNVAKAIADIPFNESPVSLFSAVPHSGKVQFYPKLKSLFGKMGQIAVAACVMLSVIGGVQYYSSKKAPTPDIPALNTMPIGINLSPVGGLNPVMNSPEMKRSADKISQKQYEKIYLLLQDHELQKRLNAAL